MTFVVAENSGIPLQIVGEALGLAVTLFDSDMKCGKKLKEINIVDINPNKIQNIIQCLQFSQPEMFGDPGLKEPRKGKGKNKSSKGGRF